MINLMIADDNVQWVEQFSKILKKNDDFNIVSTTYNGLDTILNYMKFKPDVLLLDLDMPRINGIEIINQLSSIPEEKNLKNIIVISGNINCHLKIQNISKVRTMFFKPFNLDLLCENIREIKEINSKNFFIKNKIDYLFSNLNFDVCAKGTDILKNAVYIAFNNVNLKNNIKNLVQELSKSYSDISPKTIRSDMDKAINTMYEFNNCDPNFLCSFFPDYYGFKPTTKYFIRYSVEYLTQNFLNKKL